MRAIPSIMAALLLLAATACSTVRTNYDFDPSVDFGAWRSYAWYPDEEPPTGNPRLDNPLVHERIEAAIDDTLALRGYKRVEGGDPDFYVNYHLSTEQKLDVQTMDRGYGAGYGRAWRGYGWGGVGWTETRVEQYDEGALIIDFLDFGSRKLAWRGSGRRRLARNPSPEKTTERVKAAVAEIIEQFPPK